MFNPTSVRTCIDDRPSETPLDTCNMCTRHADSATVDVMARADCWPGLIATPSSLVAGLKKCQHIRKVERDQKTTGTSLPWCIAIGVKFRPCLIARVLTSTCTLDKNPFNGHYDRQCRRQCGVQRVKDACSLAIIVLHAACYFRVVNDQSTSIAYGSEPLEWLYSV